VVVTEETNPWAYTAKKFVEAGGLADVASSSPVAFKANAGWRVVDEQDIEWPGLDERVDLVAGVMALGIALELLRRPRVVRGTEAARDTLLISEYP
jgi:hypothetical protein